MGEQLGHTQKNTFVPERNKHKVIDGFHVFSFSRPHLRTREATKAPPSKSCFFPKETNGFHVYPCFQLFFSEWTNKKEEVRRRFLLGGMGTTVHSREGGSPGRAAFDLADLREERGSGHKCVTPLSSSCGAQNGCFVFKDVFVCSWFGREYTICVLCMFPWF